MVLNPSQIFSADSIRKYLESVNKKVSNETIYTYLELITNAIIMSKAIRYDIRGKKILTRSDKYYLTDTGLARIINTGFKIEIGPLLENIVYNELIRRGNQVYIGRTKNGEIDFIAIKDEQISYYQVAYLLASEEVIEREFGAFESISDNYSKYVLSLDRIDFSREGIIHLNIIDFLLEVK